MKLLPGEKIDFAGAATRQQVARTPEEIDEKYVRGEVRIITEQARYPLNTIVTMLESGNYKLNPEFQRRHRWTVEKQSRLIESFIMNVPIPPIFLYEVRFAYYEVMDGLQRLTAINDFYKGAYRLLGLEEWGELNGMDYSHLPEQVRRGIDRRYLSSIILLQETAKQPEEARRLKQLVFERINSGGEKLEPHESRNALYNGPLNDLCIKLARTPSFCRMWGIPEVESEGTVEPISLIEDKLYRKMEDVELVLRFFAFRQIESVEQGRLRDYLDRFLRYGNTFGDRLLTQYHELFVNTSDFVFEVLGETAFHLMRPKKTKETAKRDTWGWYDRPTKVLYDPIMYAFSQHLKHRASLAASRTQIRSALEAFYQRNFTAFEGRSTNQQDIIKRKKLFLDFLATFAA